MTIKLKKAILNPLIYNNNNNNNNNKLSKIFL